MSFVHDTYVGKLQVHAEGLLISEGEEGGGGGTHL